MGKVLDVGKKGFHFQDLVEKVFEFYRKKGYSKEKALDIAKRTAGKVFWKKFGKRKGRQILSEAKRLSKKKSGERIKS